MSGYSDLSCYESDDERRAVCAEMARMLRIVPLSLTPASPSRDALPIPSPGLAGAGDPLVETHA